ncbi:MAG: hypothetical protein M3463_05670 [Verrucomicrobiota bacterium]|nr:hypothetical protein [Verrucomicrobiota bacterium]
MRASIISERCQLLGHAERCCEWDAVCRRAKSALVTAGLVIASGLCLVAGYFLAFVTLVLGFICFAGVHEAWVAAACCFGLLFSLSKASAWCWESARHRGGR